MATLALICPECRQYAQVQLQQGQPLQCPRCSKKWGEAASPDKVFEKCPVCACNQFYLQKDFNQALGCLIMLVGIVLVPFTYGLSMVIFAGIDWIFFKKVPTMAVCYRCGGEFRGLTPLEHLKPFMHHIGVKYDPK